MVSRTTVMTLPIALTLVLTGCSGTGDDAAEQTPPAEASQSTDAASAPEESESAGTEDAEGDAAASTDIEDLPDYVKPYPDSTVLSSSVAPAETDKDTKKPEQVSLVVRAEADAKDIFKFYEKELGKADFEAYGDEVKTDSGRVMNFKHKKNDGLLVVTVAEDPENKDNSIVTVGGNIVQ
ncbi:MAG: hypothetical protein ACTH2U_13675 [Brevibacterium sp.]